LDHADTRSAITCERALLGRLGGGCQIPIGGFATIEDRKQLWLRAMVGRPDGSEILRDLGAGPAAEPAELGRQVAERLLARGADKILGDVYDREVAVPRQP
jgi:hydroxymethylbilane synthase